MLSPCSFRSILALMLAGFLGLAAERGEAAGLPVRAFANGRPRFDLQRFFTGHTRSWGILENRAGEPAERIVTDAHGRMAGNELRLEQDLYIEKRPRQHRSWKIRRLDAHRFEATANDMVGVARGEAYGNAFEWSFTLAVKPGNPLFNVTMTQHFYLLPDGTMLNRDTIKKAGLLIGEVTEHFRRL